MRIWWTTACYELLKYSRKKSILYLLFALPLVLILLLGSAFNTDIKPAKVALFIADQGELRAGINSFWEDSSLATYVHILPAKSEKEVQDWVREGRADYGVYVPDGFSKALIAGGTASWQTFSGRYEEKNIAAAAIVNSYMTNVNVHLAVISAFGQDYSASKDEKSNEAHPGAETIKVGTLGAGENNIFGKASAMQYYSVAYLIMFLLYGGMSAALALLDQKESGTLQRIYAIPASFRVIVFGIVSGVVFLAFLQAMFITGFTAYFYGVDWGGHFGWIMLICLLTIAAGIGLAIIIASFAGSDKTTQTMISIIIFTMTFLSGGMVAGIQNMVGGIDKWTINYWANTSLRTIMNGDNLSSLWNDVGMLALIALILSVIAVIRLPKVVKKHV